MCVSDSMHFAVGVVLFFIIHTYVSDSDMPLQSSFAPHGLPNLLHDFSEQCFPKCGNSIVAFIIQYIYILQYVHTFSLFHKHTRVQVIRIYTKLLLFPPASLFIISAMNLKALFSNSSYIEGALKHCRRMVECASYIAHQINEFHVNFNLNNIAKTADD